MVTKQNYLGNRVKTIGVSAIVAVCLACCMFITGCQNSQVNTQNEEQQQPIEVNSQTANLPNVVVLTTGGTIAGSGESGKSTGYKSGAIGGDSLVQSVPDIAKYANITSEEICNVNSDDMTSELWIKLAKRINQISQDPSVNGIVITHGTDTMEETAYFLNLTVKTEKPVVITGSMRPSTALSADGPLNLLQSVRVAASNNTGGHGVMCVFSDMIYPARSFTKVSTYAVNAMSSNEIGALGMVRDDGVYIFNNEVQKHTTQSEFDISNATRLPDVTTVYFDVDADPTLLQAALNKSQGVVISGAGAGEYSLKFKDVLEKTSKPVFLTGHSSSGSITQESTILPNKTVACNFMSPQKAKVLLRLALLKYPNITFEEQLRIAEEY